MIVITIAFVGISLMEWNYLKNRNRKKRTYWLAGCFMLAAYIYLMLVYAVKDFPSSNRLIEWVFTR